MSGFVINLCSSPAFLRKLCPVDTQRQSSISAVARANTRSCVFEEFVGQLDALGCVTTFRCAGGSSRRRRRCTLHMCLTYTEKQ